MIILPVISARLMFSGARHTAVTIMMARMKNILLPVPISVLLSILFPDIRLF
jgi:hypothetical protein